MFICYELNRNVERTHENFIFPTKYISQKVIIFERNVSRNTEIRQSHSISIKTSTVIFTYQFKRNYCVNLSETYYFKLEFLTNFLFQSNRHFVYLCTHKPLCRKNITVKVFTKFNLLVLHFYFLRLYNFQFYENLVKV